MNYKGFYNPTPCKMAFFLARWEELTLLEGVVNPKILFSGKKISYSIKTTKGMSRDILMCV